MKVLRRLTVFALTLSLGLLMLGGCSSQNKTSGSSASEAVTLQFWTISLQPKFTTFFNDLISNYKSENPNVTIQWTDLPENSIQQKLITSIAGGIAPDVVNLNTEMALALAGKKALVDLNKEATSAQKSVYIKTLYDSTKLGNSVYAFPWYASPSVMVYNKDLFSKAGLSAVPKTYEEALSMAKTMKSATGAYLFMPMDVEGILYLDNLPTLNSAKTKAAFNTAATYDLLSKYQAGVQQDIIPKAGWNDWATMLKLFETEKLAVINSTGSSIGRIKDEAPQVYQKIGIAEPMTGKAGVINDNIMNIVVPQASKHHTAAIAFAAFVTNDDSQLAFCKQVAIFPSTTKASKDSYFTSDTSTLDGQARAVSAKTLTKSVNFSLGIDQQEDVTKAVDAIYESAVEGSTPLKSAIANAETNVNQLLAQKS